MQKINKIIPLTTIMILLSSCGFEIVDTGRRGLKIQYGKIVSDPLPEDIYFYNPLTTDIKEINVQEDVLEGSADSFTMDTQIVKVNYALTYYPDPNSIGDIYKQFGDYWREKLIKPNVLGALKDAIGKYKADDLVRNREVAKNAAFEGIKAVLENRKIFVTSLNFTNLDFQDEYEKAVERKVVAIQRAAESKNKTVEIEEQSKQQVISAKAEAESMAIRAKALSQNKNLVEYEAVQKWDGKLPQYSLGGSVPFINLNKL